MAIRPPHYCIKCGSEHSPLDPCRCAHSVEDAFNLPGGIIPVKDANSVVLAPPRKPPVLGTQVGGSHYTDCKIQPIEYIWANGLGFSEGNVVKYITRWRSKGGIKDLEKAKHHIALLIEHAEAEGLKK